MNVMWAVTTEMAYSNGAAANMANAALGMQLLQLEVCLPCQWGQESPMCEFVPDADQGKDLVAKYTVWNYNFIKWYPNINPAYANCPDKTKPAFPVMVSHTILGLTWPVLKSTEDMADWGSWRLPGLLGTFAHYVDCNGNPDPLIEFSAPASP